MDNESGFFYWDKIVRIDSITSLNKVKNSELYRKTFNIITKTLEYNNYLNEKEKYKRIVIKAFMDKQNLIKEYLKKCLKNDYNKIENREFKAFICNPLCYKGESYYSDNFIMFGSTHGILNNDPNYEITYIIHECLHLLYPYKNIDNKEEYMTHSIIELISDYGLGQKLNGKPYYGHDYLFEYVKTIYPQFIDYLSNEKYKSLTEFIDYISLSYQNKTL